MSSLPRSEHPNPLLFRPEWQCLNGTWEFATDRERVGHAEGWPTGTPLRDRITVPFTLEWPMSGVERQIHEVVWYARKFNVPGEWLTDERQVLLHFGAVDYRCKVWVNGVLVGHHEGGHVPFSFEISRCAKAGENRVCLMIEDPLDPHQPRGKQAVAGVGSGIHYPNTTGIWQTVWLESVPTVRISELVLSTELGSGSDLLLADVYAHGPGAGLRATVEVSWRGDSVATGAASFTGGRAHLEIPISDAQRWTPETPNLYELQVTLYHGEAELDRVQSYTGLRTIEVSNGRFFLNGEEVFLRMALDQGYWPESGLTAPTDEALRADVEWMKRLGFNGARKHQKMEDPRWLYWCDKLGLLVWGEMANAWAWSPLAAARIEKEWAEAVRRDRSHPCIIAWVPMNESWGVPRIAHGDLEQFAHLERLVDITHQIDPTRPVVDNDGWDHVDAGDIFAIHDYTPSGEDLKSRYADVMAGGEMTNVSWGNGDKLYLSPGAKYRGQPVVLSEVGGYLTLPENTNGPLDVMYSCYGHTEGGAALEDQYRQLMNAIGSLTFCSGFCYTQLTDVEQEQNGLLTYDRRPKVDPEVIAEIHRNMR